MKEIILQHLSEVRMELCGELDKDNLTPARKNVIPVRIRDNYKVSKEIENIDFVSELGDKEKYASKYGTFFNARTMYYDLNKMKDLTEWQKVILLLSEFFNVKQGYYSANRLGKATIRVTKSWTLLSLFHIGLISEYYRVSYGQSARGKLWPKFNKEYPNHNIIIAEPTKDNVQQLYSELLLENNFDLGRCDTIFETEDTLKAKVKCNCMYITTLGLIMRPGDYQFYQDNNTIYYNKNDKKMSKKNEIKLFERLSGEKVGN